MHKVISLLSCLIVSLPLLAENVDVTSATEKAQHFFESHHKVQRSRGAVPAKVAPTPVLVYTGTTANTLDKTTQATSGAKARRSAADDERQEQPSFYVFNAGDDAGFVIIAGDDAADPVLGYSDGCMFDPEDIPDGLQYMLSRYAAQIESLRSTRSTKASAKAPESGTIVVDKLLTTTWGQGYPYNYKVQGLPTGCANTAIAQIINYYQYPRCIKVKSPSSISFNVNNVSFPKIPVDGTTSVYDYASFKDQYGDINTVTSSEAEAIGSFFLDISTGIYNRSGTASFAGLPALTEYYNEVLGYDPFGYFYQIKDATQYQELGHDILCKELDNGRPVFTGNFDHAFVIDGYANDGCFHVNWGWDGRSDGWFKIYVSNDVGYLEDGILFTYIGFAPPADKVHPVVREYEKGLVDCDIVEALTPGSQQTFESKFTVTNVEHGVDSVGLAIMDGANIKRIISKSLPIDTYVEYMSFSYVGYDNNFTQQVINYVAGYKDMKGIKTSFFVPDNSTSDVITYNLAMVYLSEGTWHLPNKYPNSLSDAPVIAEPLTIKVAPKGGELRMTYDIGPMSSFSLDDKYEVGYDTVLVDGKYQPVYMHTLTNDRNVRLPFALENDIQGEPFYGDVKVEMVRHEDQKTVFSTILKDIYIPTKGGWNTKELELTIDNLPTGTYFPLDEGRVYIRKDGEQEFEQLTERVPRSWSQITPFGSKSYYSFPGSCFRIVDKATAEESAPPYITKFWWTADDGRPWDIHFDINGGLNEANDGLLKHFLYPNCQSGYNVTVYNPSSKPKRIALLFTNFPGTDTQQHAATDTLQLVEKTLAPKETYTYTGVFESKKVGDQLFLHAEYQDMDENLLWFKPGVYELMGRGAYSGMEAEEVFKGKAHVMYLADTDKEISHSMIYLGPNNTVSHGGAYRFFADTVATAYYEQFPNFKFRSFEDEYPHIGGIAPSTDSVSYNKIYFVDGRRSYDGTVQLQFSLSDAIGGVYIPPVDSIITEVYDANKKLLYTTAASQAYMERRKDDFFETEIWNPSLNIPSPTGDIYIKLYFKVFENVYPIHADREYLAVTAHETIGIDEYDLETGDMNVANEIYNLYADDNCLVRGATTDLKYSIKNNSPYYNFNGTIAVYCDRDRSVLSKDEKLSEDIPVFITPFATVYGSIPVTVPADYEGDNIRIYIKATDSKSSETTKIKIWPIAERLRFLLAKDIPVVDNMVIVSVQPTECEYGEMAEPQIRVSGGCPGKTFEWTTLPTIECTATASSPKGVYDVYVSGGEGNIPIGDYRGNVLTIKPAQATIRPRDMTRLTGEANPLMEYDITGLRNGDTEDVILFKPELTCEATSESKAGTYPITIKNDVTAVNYEFTQEDGALTVEDPVDPGIAQIIVGNYTREYGDDNPDIQIVINSQERARDTLDANNGHHYIGTGCSEPEWEEMPTITVDATKTSDAGTYPISVTGGKLKGYNGFEIVDAGQLTVKKANLQVIARDTTLHYRNFWKPEYFKYEGFKNGDDVSVLDKVPSLSNHMTDEYGKLILDENGRFVRLVNNCLYRPEGGEDNNYHLVYPQADENAPMFGKLGHLTVVPDTIEFSLGPVLTSRYGDVNGALIPNESTYDQFPSDELPEGYAVYDVRTKTGSWIVPVNDKLDVGDYRLQQDTLFVGLGKDAEGTGHPGSRDEGYVAYYIPTLRMTPVELSAYATEYTYSKINWINMYDEVKFTYSGFVAGDDESVLTQEPTWRLADGETPLPGDHRMVIDKEGKAKNYTFKYYLGYRSDSIIHINTASVAAYFSQFNSEYSGAYECELKWKDDMVFKNTYIGGTDVVKIEDYGIYELIDSVFPGRYDEYWATNGRLSKQYDYWNSFDLNYDKTTGSSTITYNMEGDCYVRIGLNLPYELFEDASCAYVSSYVNVGSRGGDVNGDGDVDIADAVCIVNYVVGKPNTSFNKVAADVNGDGDVDIADAVRIVNLVVGKISALSRPALRPAVEEIVPQ